ncbi:MAG: HAMP domain-containing protein [Nitrospinota bacterium]|nr:MAG: HAMP domain-containing protein [Nitrospinota bacterium]
MRLSLGAKLQLAFLVAALLVCVAGGIAFFSIGQFSREVQTILKNDVLIAKIGEEIRFYILEARRAGQNFIIFADPSFLQRGEEALAELHRTLQRGRKLSRKPKTQEKYAQIEALLQRYEARFSRLSQGEKLEKTQIELSTELGTLTDQILRLATQLSQETWSELDLHSQDANRIAAVVKRDMVLIIAIPLVISILLALYLPRRIVRPIQRLTQLVKAVQEEGKLETHVSIEGEDEIGELGRFVNRMIAQLKVFDQLKVQKIAEEQRKLEMLATLLSDGIMIFDAQQKLSFANAATQSLFALDLSAYQGTRIDEIPLPSQIKEEILRALQHQERLQSKLLRIPPHNGKPVHNLSLSTCFVRDDQGKIRDMIVVCHVLDGEGKPSHGPGADPEKVQALVAEIVARIKEAFALPDTLPPA